MFSIVQCLGKVILCLGVSWDIIAWGAAGGQPGVLLGDSLPGGTGRVEGGLAVDMFLCLACPPPTPCGLDMG